MNEQAKPKTLDELVHETEIQNAALRTENADLTIRIEQVEATERAHREANTKLIAENADLKKNIELVELENTGLRKLNKELLDDGLIEEYERLRNGIIEQSNRVCQILAAALGDMKYVDDTKNFPDATEADGYFTGEGIPEDYALRAAETIAALRDRLARYDAMMAADGKYEGHTPGPWRLHTGCSWRRFGTPDGRMVCEPTKAADGQPDLHFPNGGQDGPDARLMADAPALLMQRNAAREALDKTASHCGHCRSVVEEQRAALEGRTPAGDAALASRKDNPK